MELQAQHRCATLRQHARSCSCLVFAQACSPRLRHGSHKAAMEKGNEWLSNKEDVAVPIVAAKCGLKD